MATAPMPADLVEHSTVAALEEKAKLKKHFSRFDIFFFLICTIVGLDTLGAVSNFGAQAFVWLLFLGIFFFTPYALLTAELGASFREEGGSYIWSKLALGRPIAGVNAVLYWLANPIWLGGALCITALEVFNEFFFDLGTAGSYVFAMIFIWFATWAAILSFGIGKWIPTIGAWGRVLLLGGFTFTVILYAIKNGVQGVGASDFKPSFTVFIAAVPVLFFNYVGFELPSAAGDEMKDAQKDVPYTVKRALAVAVVCYGAPILAILLVLPAAQITSLDGFVSAIKIVFSVYGGSVTTAADGTLDAELTGFGSLLGHLAAAGFIWALLSSGTTWIMGADRAQAVAAYDGCGPRWMGTFSGKYGTPIAVNLLSGVVSTLFFIGAFTFTSGDSAKYFVAALGLAISTTTISYLAIFPALYLLRKSHPHVPRPYKIPGGDGVALLVSALTFFWAALASVALLWPGLFDPLVGGKADDALPEEFAGERFQYEAIQLGALTLFIALGILFYALGAKTRRQQVDISLIDESVVDPANIAKD